MASSKYKLIYFDWTGMAEATRYIFAYAKVPYEEERIPLEGNMPSLSPELKARFPWGQLPVLEVDGRQIAQSRAINRFLANRFGLAGTDEFESAKCDEIADAVMDYVAEFFAYFRETDPFAKTEIMKTILQVSTQNCLRKLNQILEENGSAYLVGKSLTWADITVHHLLQYFEEFCDISLYEQYPVLEKAKDSFYDIPEIKNWVATRPKPALHFSDEVFQEVFQKLEVSKQVPSKRNALVR